MKLSGMMLSKLYAQSAILSNKLLRFVLIVVSKWENIFAASASSMMIIQKRCSFFVTNAEFVELVDERNSFTVRSASIGSCYSLELRDNHSCVENSMKNFCPVCYEYLFESIKGTTIMKCGHTMHEECFSQMHGQNQYRCPICNKTVIDMSATWRLLDVEIEVTSMPLEYQYKVSILCNDCNTYSKVPFHILGQKCSNCSSYNTRRISALDHE